MEVSSPHPPTPHQATRPWSAISKNNTSRPSPYNRHSRCKDIRNTHQYNDPMGPAGEVARDGGTDVKASDTSENRPERNRDRKSTWKTRKEAEDPECRMETKVVETSCVKR